MNLLIRVTPSSPYFITGVKERELIKNRYKIIGNDVIIYLDRRDGSVLETVIDISDFDKILGYKYKWFSKCNINTDSYYGYSTVYRGSPNLGFQNSTVKLSKYILDYTGDQEVDHMDHDTLNNRRSNLRVAEFKDNSTHRKTRNKNNKSGYRNVCFIDGFYIVQLQVDGKNTVLGKFKDVHEAGKFAKEMREKYYGNFAGGN